MAHRTQIITNQPKGSSGRPLGGVILLTPPLKVREKTSGALKGVDLLTSGLQSAGLVVTRLTLPGSQTPLAKGEAKKRAVEKSVRLAIESLSAQCGENGQRIAVVTEGRSADLAVLGSRSSWQVRSFVLLSGRLSQEAKDLLVQWQSNPVLCLVSSEDRVALRDMTDVYFMSKHPDTDIKVFENIGSGLQLIELYKARYPERAPLESTIAEWLQRCFSSVGRAREVEFTTKDGWKIFGNLLLPDLNGEKHPGVVLLHSGRSDRFVFTDLERLLVKAGFAVLNIDWRGRGKSINKGKYFGLSKEERTNGKLDAQAAIDFLASQRGVDSGRIGLVGIIHGAEHAVRGSIGDPRVKALAILHGYIPSDDKERDYLTRSGLHVMYVTSKDHNQVTETMRQLYQASPDKLTRLLVFEGGAIGYQLFELDDKFQPAIVEWLQEALAH
jgi:dienelactone hydrolase